jgi:hypothetical protein
MAKGRSIRRDRPPLEFEAAEPPDPQALPLKADGILNRTDTGEQLIIISRE